jgi:hypothetical protein
MAVSTTIDGLESYRSGPPLPTTAAMGLKHRRAREAFVLARAQGILLPCVQPTEMDAA